MSCNLTPGGTVLCTVLFIFVSGGRGNLGIRGGE